MSSIKMVVALQPGSYKASDVMMIESSDNVVWVPANIGAKLRLTQSVVELLTSVKLWGLDIAVRFYDAQGNLLNETTVYLGGGASTELDVPSGTTKLLITITKKYIRIEEDATIYPDNVVVPSTPPEILKMEMVGSSGNVVDSASILLGAVVSGMTSYYYASVVAQNPQIEIPVSTAAHLSYIDKLVATITKVVGNPQPNDYVEVDLLDPYKYLVNSCRITPIYSGYSCVLAVPSEISWIRILLNSSVAGLSVDVAIEERIKGFT